MKKREKIFYPSNQIQKGFYTKGTELEDENNKEYIGQYHIYVNGAIYSEADYVKGKSKVLQKISTKPKNNQTYSKLTNNEYDLNLNDISIVVNKYYVKTDEDIENSYYIRYFIKRTNNKEFKETNKDTFESLENNDKFLRFFEVFNIKWYFNNPMYDYIKDNIIVIKGHFDENTRIINETNLLYIGFKQYMNYD